MSHITEQINAYLEPLAQDQKFSGAVLASVHGEIVYSNAFGKANIELAVDNTIKTKFRIASITKTFTGVCILQLVERGQLHLEDPLTTAGLFKRPPMVSSLHTPVVFLDLLPFS
ncbi:hypothetical protein PMSD_01460 [Paenibacillus macquariensis subsp. defensor]|nr:hypothetical protein PMSD_01460 [Paenibacillus macquariensis subsp. defensor]